QTRGSTSWAFPPSLNPQLVLRAAGPGPALLLPSCNRTQSILNPPTLLCMKTTPELTEPRSFADALADLRFLQQRVATATRVLLCRQGWRHTRLNPAHLWLWSK